MAHVGYPGMISKLDGLDQKSKQTIQVDRSYTFSYLF